MSAAPQTAQPVDGVELLQQIMQQAAEGRAEGQPPEKIGKTAAKEPKSAAPTEPRATPGSATFFTYVDGDGVQHIVNDWHKIPQKHQSRAKTWTLEQRDRNPAEALTTTIADSVATLAESSPALPSTPAADGALHAPSLVLGLLAAVVFGAGLFALRKRPGRLFKWLGAIVALAVGAAVYFGWVRSQAGLGDDIVVRPAAIVDDARKASGEMQRKLDAQQRALDGLADSEP